MPGNLGKFLIPFLLVLLPPLPVQGGIDLAAEVTAATEGLDGWYFFASDEEVAYSRAENLFRPVDLDRYARILEERRKWLADRGIPYLVVVAPNKSTLYAEYLPDGMTPLGSVSRLDQLLAKLAAETSVDLLDLRPALQDAKATERIYHKTDSHWNDAGAHAAYLAILDRLAPAFPQLAPRPRGSFDTDVVTIPGLDLAVLLGIEHLVSEAYLHFLPLIAREATDPEVPGVPLTPDPYNNFPYYGRLRKDGLVTLCPSGEAGTAVVLRNSFMAQVTPFLSEHFQRIVYRESPLRFDPEVIKAESPDLVIQQLVERQLMFRLPENAIEVSQSVVTSVQGAAWRGYR